MRKIYLILFVVGFIVPMGVSYFQHSPGYMDADYYYAGGLRISQGQGLTEPFLWNYLDDPESLPHPSFTYWMPLASLLAFIGLFIAPNLGFVAARMSFILVAAFIPPLTAALSFTLFQKRALAVVAGLLAAFSGFYAAFLPVTDTFGIYMLGGGSFLLLAYRWYEQKFAWYAILLGLIAGLMHLARADGLLWFGMFFVVLWLVYRDDKKRIIFPLMFGVFSYLLVMSPWFVRNLVAFGTLMSPGSGRALWLTEYDRLFAYPASQLNMSTWLESGLSSILEARWWALKINFQSLMGVQLGIFLVPFVLIALWRLRHNFAVKIGVLAWGLTFFAMTIVFPFAGARGGFFHSGAALQPLWWVLAPAGLDVVTKWAAERIPTWTVERAQSGFRIVLLMLTVFLTSVLILSRVVASNWDIESQTYRDAELLIASKDTDSSAPVIVANPPGYFTATDRSAIALPDGTFETLLLLRSQFGARYVILNEASTPAGLLPLFHEGNPQLILLGDVDGTKVFKIP